MKTEIILAAALLVGFLPVTGADTTEFAMRNVTFVLNNRGALQSITRNQDGLEGAWSTGMGQYGRTLFAQTWFNALLRPARRCKLET